MASYHYNHDGETGKCDAQNVEDCPYKGNGHFPSDQEAQQAFEHDMQDNTYFSIQNDHVKNMQKLRENLTELSHQVQQLSPEQDAARVQLYESMGQEVLRTAEEYSGVSFHNEKELTGVELHEISQSFQHVLTELDNNRTPDEYSIDGTVQKKATEAISVLPSELIKERNRHGAIHARTLHGNSQDRSGTYYVSNMVQQYVNTPDGVHENYTKMFDTLELAHGEVSDMSILNDDIQQLETGNRTTHASRYNATTGKYEQVYIGKPVMKQKGVKYKKVADSVNFKSLHSGESTTIHAPLYARYTAHNVQREVIEAHSAKRLHSESAHTSVLLHEYAHSVQAKIDGNGHVMESGEKQLFSELTRHEQPYYAADYDVEVYSGFPDTYMGNVSGREVLPCAVQGILRPEQSFSSNTLFEVQEDATKEANRKRILNWVSGYLANWAVQETTDEQKS